MLLGNDSQETAEGTPKGEYSKEQLRTLLDVCKEDLKEARNTISRMTVGASPWTAGLEELLNKKNKQLIKKDATHQLLL